jgi:acyl-coenzyme A synthetase/AMP-(fatty) acid ligase
LIERFGISEGSVIVPTVPSHHIYGLLFGVLVPLLCGGAYLRETPLHATAIASALREHEARVLVSVPAHLRAFSTLEPDRLPAGMRVFSSGAPLPRDLAHEFARRFGVSVTEVLGSTETGGIATREGPDEPWTPLPGVSVSADDAGRMLVRSPFLADPESAWVTGDAIDSVDTLGRFRHLGRVDGVVKVAGKRVSLAEIEARLLAIVGVEDAAVIALEVGGARGVETVALVVAPALSARHLRDELSRFIDPVVLPRRIHHVGELPRAPNGKLARVDLLELLERAPARSPVVLSQSDDASGVRFVVRIPKDLVALRGHYTRFPVVAGVVQLDLAARLARQRWPDLGVLRRVLRLKFKRPLRPGDELVLVLSRAPGGARVAFRCEAAHDAEPVSTGTLDWEHPRS